MPDEADFGASLDRHHPSGTSARGWGTAVPPLLRVDGVGVRFGGVAALDGVTFDVPAARIVAVIGPNGAGKTTLFNCLSRIYPVHSGDILLDGKSILDQPVHRMVRYGIARTFQNLALFDSMTVLENVRLGAHARTRGNMAADALGAPGPRRRRQLVTTEARALLAELDLEPLAHRRVDELPQGVRKRVELARALFARPRLLLLDEPVAGLNHREITALEQLLQGICAGGVTILLVEHHVEFVNRLSHYVIALDFGRVIADGAPAEVAGHEAVIAAYLGVGTR